MIVGVLREIKDNENRVALTPEGARQLVEAGHSVLVEQGAGLGSGLADDSFRACGAHIVATARNVCARARLILKIKEPEPDEYSLFGPHNTLFTFFHFASSRHLTEAMLASGAACIAYETVQTPQGRVPLLAPMSEVAGKMAPLVAASYLATKPAGGKGILVSAVSSVAPARFLVLGGGNAGRAAATVALGLGAAVTLIDNSRQQLEVLRDLFPAARGLMSTPETIQEELCSADAVVGTVHVAGARTPQLITRAMLCRMEAGSVLVDVAIDQGGCCETSRPTSHSQPVYVEEGVIHYCVANMPGVFPRTATWALTGATLPYILQLANEGPGAFENPDLLKGLNIAAGCVTNRQVAQSHGLPYTEPRSVCAQAL